MTAGQSLRKLLFVLHIVCSLGWLGGALTYIGLIAVLMTDKDPHAVATVYLAMRSLVWTVMLPLALGALVTGVVQALATPWGLARYYWVLAKLVLNLFAVLVLLDYTQELRLYAGVAAKTTLSSADVHNLQGTNHLIHAVGGTVVLLVAVVLAVYKPWGLTRRGRRRRLSQQERRRTDGAALVS